MPRPRGGARPRHHAVRRRGGRPDRRRSCATPPRRRSSRSTTTSTICPALEGTRCHTCRGVSCARRRQRRPASMPAAAARSSARSAPSSMCRGASRAAARPTTSSTSCARTARRASTASSSPTTISRATRIGRRSSTASSSCASSDGIDVALHHPGRHAVPQDPEFRREGEARRRHPHLHRAGEHQPRQPAGGEEAAEQDHRVPHHAARLEGGGHLDLRGLHPGFSRRHAGIDPPRHRDHQEGAAARHPGVLLPHAAAGLGGPQGAVDEGRGDGPRPQQVRPRARAAPRIRG